MWRHNEYLSSWCPASKSFRYSWCILFSKMLKCDHRTSWGFECVVFHDVQLVKKEERNGRKKAIRSHSIIFQMNIVNHFWQLSTLMTVMQIAMHFQIQLIASILHTFLVLVIHGHHFFRKLELELGQCAILLHGYPPLPYPRPMLYPPYPGYSPSCTN